MSYRGLFGQIEVKDQHGVTAVIGARKSSDDGVALDEVWRENVYRMHPDYVRDKVVLDIGANIGAFSVWCAAAGAFGVLAYEPDQKNFTELKLNTRKLEPIIPIRAAVSGFNGTGSIKGKEAGSGSGYLDSGNDFEVVSFKDVLEMHDEFAVLKMDIEGGEYPCFGSIKASDLSHVERIVLEFHGPGMGVDPEGFDEACGDLMMKIAEWGHLETLGRPSMGGMMYGVRY